MGNTNAKESREASSPLSPGDPRSPTSPHGRPSAASSSRPRHRSSRSDLGGLFSLHHHPQAASSSSAQPPYEQRRETKQEREARRLERERQTRLVERERSLKEEHVDGGYLVTLGTYVGPEDYSKPVVRQLQMERKLAPFWRGLNDVSDTWTEYQIVAMARGLPLPPADAPPPEELIPRPMSAVSPSDSSQNLNNLMVPMGGRTQSVASDKSAAGPSSSLPSPTSPGPAARNSSPFKHRPRGLAAALSISSRNNSTTDIAPPREIKLAHDPFVNGQPVEVFLYKEASECPICFLYYPPYLNHTRCCDQPICSECFVQIKRADPHYPEGHGDGENSTANPEEQAGLLISEPACCPYCQQPEFGVTYDPPPFRRGLAYSGSGYGSGPHLGIAGMGTAMSSSSSLNSNLSPTSLASPTSAPSSGRRRTQSLSANAPNVITTDRVRPDWATKLASQRAHIARRAAAATALHTAAFLMGNSDNRTFRVGRFSRRNTTDRSGAGSSGGGAADGNSPGGAGSGAGGGGGGGESGSASPGGAEAPARSNSGRGILGGRRSRMEDLEEMMFAEAIRLSLAAEEERKRKAEKEERKEAKRREKEEKKAAKAAAKSSASGPYGGSSGHSSLSGSALSLPSLGLGRRRGNSAASNLRMEASVASALAATVVGSPSAASAALGPGTDKGKGVDRPATATSATQGSVSDSDQAAAAASSSASASAAATTAPQTIPSPAHRGPSHLRQMSNASSVTASSYTDTLGGSYTGQSHLHDPRASGLSLGGRSNASEGDGEGEGRAAEKDPSASTEPMCNFTSLAEMVGVQLEGEHAGRRLSAIGRDALTTESTKVADDTDAQHIEHAAASVESQIAKMRDTKEQSASAPTEATEAAPMIPSPPALVVTPGTPALQNDGFDSGKQLGAPPPVDTTVQIPDQHQHQQAQEYIN